MGSGRGARRAASTAIARTTLESYPPEKLTRHGGRRSASRTHSRSAPAGCASGPARSAGGTPPPGPTTYPDAISSAVRGDVSCAIAPGTASTVVLQHTARGAYGLAIRAPSAIPYLNESVPDGWPAVVIAHEPAPRTAEGALDAERAEIPL